MQIARPSELTAVSERDIFERPPGELNDADQLRWYNFRRQYYRASELIDRPQDFPLQVDIGTTSTCQLTCAFCVFGNGSAPPRAIMPIHMFHKIIDEGSEYGLVSIKLNYINEPLLRRDLPRLVQYARSRGVLNTYIATNGLLLKDERAAELIDAGLSKVMVSLDAATPETFKVMRNSDRFSEIRRNVMEFIRLRNTMNSATPYVRVNFLRTHLNAHEEEQFVKSWAGVADSIGVQTRVARPGEEMGGGRGDFRCSFPSKMLVVDADGSILPCCTFSGRTMPLGSINTMTLAEAWQKSKTLADDHRAGCGLTRHSTCASCVGASS